MLCEGRLKTVCRNNDSSTILISVTTSKAYAHFSNVSLHIVEKYVRTNDESVLYNVTCLKAKVEGQLLQKFKHIIDRENKKG